MTNTTASEVPDTAFAAPAFDSGGASRTDATNPPLERCGGPSTIDHTSTSSNGRRSGLIRGRADVRAAATVASTRRISTLAAVVLTTLAMVLGVSGALLTIAPAGVAVAQGGPGPNPNPGGPGPGGGTEGPGGNPPGGPNGPGPNNPPGGPTGPGTDPNPPGPGTGGPGPNPPGGGTGPGQGGGNLPGPADNALLRVKALNTATAAHAAATKAALTKLNAAIRSGDLAKIRAAQADIRAANQKLQSSIQGIFRPSSR